MNSEIIKAILDNEVDIHTVDQEYKITNDMTDEEALIKSIDLVARNAFKLGLKLGAEVFGN